MEGGGGEGEGRRGEKGDSGRDLARAISRRQKIETKLNENYTKSNFSNKKKSFLGFADFVFNFFIFGF